MRGIGFRRSRLKPLAEAALLAAALQVSAAQAQVTIGDAARGREIVLSRQIGLCTLCHAGPFGDAHQLGTIGPDLTGVGARYDEAQLRARVTDARAVNPASLMPPYGRVEGLTRVAASWRGRPALTPSQIEDVVAFLRTLK